MSEETLDFSQLQFDDEPQIFENSEIPHTDDVPYDEPDEGLVTGKKRPRGAITYEKKVRGILNTATRFAFGHKNTVPDAAALAMYGPGFAKELGNVAAVDKRVARAVDFLTEGNENPYAAMIAAAAPLIMQVVRNHEPVLAPAPRTIHVPFTKREFSLKWKVGIKLGRLRPVTHDPKDFTAWVLAQPGIQKALRESNIDVAPPSGD